MKSKQVITFTQAFPPLSPHPSKINTLPGNSTPVQSLHPNLVVYAILVISAKGAESTARVSGDGLEKEINFSALSPAAGSSSQPRASLIQEGQSGEK